jgi:hypothetical protein
MLKMKALQSFKTVQTSHPKTHCYIHEDCNLQQHHCENLRQGACFERKMPVHFAKNQVTHVRTCMIHTSVTGYNYCSQRPVSLAKPVSKNSNQGCGFGVTVIKSESEGISGGV